MVASAPFATTYAPTGMVCAVDHLAGSAGVALLRAGGSAADAAVGASAVLAVTTQHMCGMGGDLFALVHAPGMAEPAVLNASGRAGSGADPDRLRAEGHRVMPLEGDIRSVPVPGCVDGWIALHERFGRLPLVEVLEPARRYAADGFPASPTLAALAGRLADVPGADDYRAAAPLQPGTIVRRPGVARTLAAIGEHGRSAFYEGEFGEGLLALGAGEHTPEDLARPQADWVPGLAVDVWGRRVWTVPPNSQGYLTLASAWIAAGLPLPDGPEGPVDPAWAHLLIEASRQAGHDRLAVLHEGADGTELVSPERLAPRRAAIDWARAGDLGGSYGPGGTIALCAVDGDRMGVSLIQSNARGFGSMLVEPNTRIFLQNRGVGFSLLPGHPAEYQPGRRPPHTLAPALVTDPSGRTLDTVLGTMGGDSQPQVLLQLLARVLVNGESPGDAMAAGRFVLASPTEATSVHPGFDTWWHGGRVEVRLEGAARATWAEGLEARGHALGRGTNFGHAHMIRVAGDHLAGASDPRALSGAAVAH